MSPKGTVVKITREQIDARYAGKPFLRLLDCYVLNAIGQLTAQQRQVLTKLEPKLAATYGTAGQWHEIVHTQMHFPSSLPETIRGFWASYLEAAHGNGISASPDEFAMSFVDQNFGDSE